MNLSNFSFTFFLAKSTLLANETVHFDHNDNFSGLLAIGILLNSCVRQVVQFESLIPPGGPTTSNLSGEVSALCRDSLLKTNSMGER